MKRKGVNGKHFDTKTCSLYAMRCSTTTTTVPAAQTHTDDMCPDRRIYTVSFVSILPIYLTEYIFCNYNTPSDHSVLWHCVHIYYYYKYSIILLYVLE